MDVLQLNDPKILNTLYLNGDNSTKMHKIFNYNENNIINKTALIVFYNNFHFTGILRKDYSHINCFIPTVYEGNQNQFDRNIFYD